MCWLKLFVSSLVSHSFMADVKCISCVLDSEKKFHLLLMIFIYLYKVKFSGICAAECFKCDDVVADETIFMNDCLF